MRRKLAFITSVVVLALAVYGERTGPRTNSPHDITYRFPVRPHSGDFQMWASISFYADRCRCSWRFQVVDYKTGQERWGYEEKQSNDLCLPGRYAYEKAFLDDTGDVLITVGPSIGGGSPAMQSVYIYTPEQTVDLPFTLLCEHPRRLYPGESRPYDLGGFFWRKLSARKWWTDANYSDGKLSITTTGTHSPTIDVQALLESVREGASVANALDQASELRRNRGTIVRWSIYAVLTSTALLILLLNMVSAFRRLLSWRENWSESPDRCPQCGYPLHGLVDPRCPECGTTFDPAVLATAKPPRPARWRAPYGTIIGAVAGVAAYIGLYTLRIQALQHTNFAGHLGMLRYSTGNVAPLYSKWWCSDIFVAALAIIFGVFVAWIAMPRWSPQCKAN